ncbi:MAG: type II toxin-antitoxin system prevent-host-death family antitoxin [Chloroflexi bacterium]|nr:type II toxin-antitoxin system prevent-host-death family antitoxin [Chloroflexota bacterium]
MVHTTYSEARQNLASLLKRVTEDRERVTITRRKGKAVVMIAEEDFASLEETAYLFRSPRNAARIIAAYESIKRGEGEEVTVEQLRRELGLHDGPSAKGAGRLSAEQ